MNKIYKGPCETCYDEGYIVEVRKERDGKTIPCPRCKIAKQL